MRIAQTIFLAWTAQVNRKLMAAFLTLLIDLIIAQMVLRLLAFQKSNFQPRLMCRSPPLLAQESSHRRLSVTVHLQAIAVL